MDTLPRADRLSALSKGSNYVTCANKAAARGCSRECDPFYCFLLVTRLHKACICFDGEEPRLLLECLLGLKYHIVNVLYAQIYRWQSIRLTLLEPDFNKN